jgi:hypothetical protein
MNAQELYSRLWSKDIGEPLAHFEVASKLVGYVKGVNPAPKTLALTPTLQDRQSTPAQVRCIRNRLFGGYLPEGGLKVIESLVKAYKAGKPVKTVPVVAYEPPKAKTVTMTQDELNDFALKVIEAYKSSQK